MRRAALLAMLVVAGLCLLAQPPSPAAAHATLVRAEPAENAFLQRAPIEIALTFSETIDRTQSAITLLDATGQPIATGPNEVSANQLTLRVTLNQLPPGIYNVIWFNVSTIDGHPLRGSYPFTVLNADGSLPDQVNQVSGLGSSTDPVPGGAEVAVRGLSLLGLALAAAGAMLTLLVPADATGLRRGLQASAGVGALLMLLAVGLHLELIRDTYPGQGLGTTLMETRAGSYWLVRAAAAFAVSVCAAALLESPRVSAAGALLGVVAFLYGYSATSHAAAGTGSGWGTIVDVIHGVAAVAWIGAVIGIALTARLAGRSIAYRRIMPRFSLIASASVIALLGSGLLDGFIALDTFDRLWTTRYGTTLLVKLVLIVPLLAVALYNARIGRRRLEALAPGEPRRFIVTVFVEAALGLLVFAAAATMTQSTVAKSVYDRPADRPFDTTVTIDGLVTRLQVDPNRTGLNRYTVTLAQPDETPVTAERVRLTFRYLEDQTIGPATLVLAPTAEPGVYAGQGPFLTLEGQWRIEVETRRADLDDNVAFFEVRPAGSPVATLRIGGTWDNPAAGLSWNEFGGIAVLWLAFAVALLKSRLPRRERRLSWGANGVALAGFGLGSVLLFGVHGHEGLQGLPRNPIFPDQNSITMGREIYQQNCIACHGRTGVPPQGLDLNPYPLDLTVHVPQHPDGQLFLFISQGVAGSAMPAWSENGLTDEQIWHVVNYLRTLGSVTE